MDDLIADGAALRVLAVEDDLFQQKALAMMIEALQAINIVSVSAGEEHSLALAEAGCVYSWGDGVYGKLGHGNIEDQRIPKLIEGLQGVQVTLVVAGPSHSLAMDAAGKVWGWGFGDDPTVGLGLTEHQVVPLQYPGLQL